MPNKVCVERDEIVIHYDHKNPVLAELMDEFFLQLFRAGVELHCSWSKDHTAHKFGKAPAVPRKAV